MSNDNINDPKAFRTLLESVKFEDTYAPMAEDDSLSDYDAEEKVAAYEEVQQELFNVISLLQSTIELYDPDKLQYWESYGLAHLKIIAGSDEYASKDESIQSLIDNAASDEDEDEGYIDQDNERGDGEDKSGGVW